MEQVFLGEYIRQRRADIGLTQAQLCEGICEPMTLSRLERGKQAPAYRTINALLERLGLPGSRYFALLSKNEVDVEALKNGIRADVILFERAAEEDLPRIRERALAKIEQLKQLSDADDRITQQYILSEKASLGKPEGPYSFEERLDMLMEAIKLTAPRFSLEEIEQGWYSMDETMLISKIARTYSIAGQRKKAIDVYRQLLRYIEKHNQELSGFAGHFCLVAHNYAICLTLEKRYKEAIEFAERGWRICIEYGNYQFLPGFLAVLAECFYFAGETQKSMKFYLQAYCIYDAIGDSANLEIIRQEMQERLGRMPPF